MQTFLPYDNFALCAEVLDNRRLGKQCMEVNQLLDCLLGFRRGWRNHPVTRMWRGYEIALIQYGFACCNEWEARYSRRQDFYDILVSHEIACRLGATYELPPWLGNEELHEKYRMLLVHKAPEVYRTRFPREAALFDVGMIEDFTLRLPKGKEVSCAGIG